MLFFNTLICGLYLRPNFHVGRKKSLIGFHIKIWGKIQLYLKRQIPRQISIFVFPKFFTKNTPHGICTSLSDVYECGLSRFDEQFTNKYWKRLQFLYFFASPVLNCPFEYLFLYTFYVEFAAIRPQAEYPFAFTALSMQMKFVFHNKLEKFEAALAQILQPTYRLYCFFVLFFLIAGIFALSESPVWYICASRQTNKDYDEITSYLPQIAPLVNRKRPYIFVPYLIQCHLSYITKRSSSCYLME